MKDDISSLFYKTTGGIVVLLSLAVYQVILIGILAWNRPFDLNHKTAYPMQWLNNNFNINKSLGNLYVY